MYQFEEHVNQHQFFWWDKKLIENLNWSLLPISSKAVFPVIACHVNKEGKAFPSEERIAIMAGVSEKTVRIGIRALENFSGFTYDYYVTKRGKRAKKFTVKLPLSNKRGSAFPFYKFILDAGLWHEMKPAAQALYPVMRYFGFFDLNLYAELENLEIEENDFEEVYPNREYDFIEAELGILAEFAGIHRNSVTASLNDLERNFLIEPLTDYSGWKVFLKSKDFAIWKRDYLNRKVLVSYKHKLRCTKTTGYGSQKLPKDAQKGAER